MGNFSSSTTSSPHRSQPNHHTRRFLPAATGHPRFAAPAALLSENLVRSHGLARLDEIVFAGWDPRGEDLFTSALRHAVVEPHRLKPIAPELRRLRPFGGRSPSAAQVIRDLNR